MACKSQKEYKPWPISMRLARYSGGVISIYMDPLKAHYTSLLEPRFCRDFGETVTPIHYHYRYHTRVSELSQSETEGNCTTPDVLQLLTSGTCVSVQPPQSCFTYVEVGIQHHHERHHYHLPGSDAWIEKHQRTRPATPGPRPEASRLPRNAG